MINASSDKEKSLNNIVTRTEIFGSESWVDGTNSGKKKQFPVFIQIISQNQHLSKMYRWEFVLHCMDLVHLNIPDLGQRIFEPTGMRFIEIKISATNTNMIFSDIEIAYFSNLAHTCNRDQEFGVSFS